MILRLSAFSMILATISATATAIAAAQERTQPAAGALLRGLDKFNGSVVDIELSVGQTIKFDRLNVTLTECLYPVGNPVGDAYAGLQITEEGNSGEAFSGWMIASSPALSAMEHSRYDIWVLRCIIS